MKAIPTVERKDIIVIGGGAAALSFSVMAGSSRRVTVLERGARVGKKLLATGNGRCNLTGVGICADDYNIPERVGGFLKRFPPEAAVCFFNSLGLETRVIGGRVYPYSECASSVSDALISAAADVGAEFLTRREVREVRRTEDGFVVSAAVLGEKGEEKGRENYLARNVVLATGSYATTGKDSLALFAALGHRVRPFAPSLTPLVTDRASVKGLNGVRVKCVAYLGGVRAEGEILFRDYGLSGIAALDLSALVARGKVRAGEEISLDLAPERTEEELAEHFAKFSYYPASRALKGMFHSRLAERIEERAGARADARTLARVIKRYTLTLSGTADASAAQVMSGGLDMAQFDDDLCSRQVPGAYAIGEALDVDGICGGANLQWAWMSAFAAAQALKKGKI